MEKSCSHCGTTSTPCWRRGPTNKPMLCNACGSRWLVKNSLEGYWPGSRTVTKGGGVAKVKCPKQPKQHAVSGAKRRGSSPEHQTSSRMDMACVHELPFLASTFGGLFFQQDSLPLFTASSSAVMLPSSGTSSEADLSMDGHHCRADDASSRQGSLPISVAEFLKQEQSASKLLASWSRPSCAMHGPSSWSRRPRKQQHPTTCF